MSSDTAAAWAYHNATKHSVGKLQTQPHYLDWSIKPLPFKVYPNLQPISLPRELPPSQVPALTALGRTPPTTGIDTIPDVPELARLLYFSAGIVRKRTYANGQEHYFRAAACTGALYHIDLYVICGDLPGLAAGVYHFGPHNFALYSLRSGDYRQVLVEASGAEPAVQHAPVIFACSSTYWRNSWKYQARAYRHCFWDCGTILANFLAVAAADEIPARVICGFADARVSALLGLDPQHEAPLALVPVGYAGDATPADNVAIAPLQLETLPLSSDEVDYPAIHEMQAASDLSTPEEARLWRGAARVVPSEPAPPADQTVLPSLEPGAVPAEAIDTVIQRRGSTRSFAHREMTLPELSAILPLATQQVDADTAPSPTETYLIVNAVEGMQPGTYYYHRAARTLELLRAGNFRRDAAYLGLGQELPGDASVNIYFLCDLEPVLRQFGNRGYRAAQLEAAIAGGRAYLAAYALHLGATGLTFFDDDVTEFFSPHAAGKSVMFLMAIGKSRKAHSRS